MQPSGALIEINATTLQGVTWALEGDLGAWDPVARVVPFALGVVLLVITGASIVRTMVIPRATISWVYAIILRGTDMVFVLLTRMMRRWPSRDRVLAWSGPLSIMFALLVWLMLFLTAYALMIYGVTDGSLSDSFLDAGSGLFTLGLVGTPSESVTIFSFLAAMTGPAVIALLIGFLPTLYQTYLSRESQVVLESGLSGAPAWGPELLARVQLLEGDTELPDILGAWMNWCASVRLTQTLYPALNRFRSPVGNRNWLIALLSLLDAGALHVALRSADPDARTIGFLEQGSQLIMTIDATEVGIDQTIRFRDRRHRVASILGIFGVVPKSPQAPEVAPSMGPAVPPGVSAVAQAVTLDNLKIRVPITPHDLLRYEGRRTSITREEFGETLDYLRSAGVEITRDDDAAYEVFSRIRGRYEGAAYHLAQRFYLTPAPWSGPRTPATPVMWPTLAARLPEE